jgi:hypothetical protein
MRRVTVALLGFASSCTIVPLEGGSPDRPDPTLFRYNGQEIQVEAKPDWVPDAAGWAVQELVRRGPWAHGSIWTDESTCNKVCSWTSHVRRDSLAGGCTVWFVWIGLHVLSNENLVVAPAPFCKNARATHCDHYVDFETGPKIVVYSVAAIPEAWHMDGSERVVVYCHVNVDATGKVVGAHIANDCDAQVAEAVQAACLKAVYEPARRRDGTPVAAWAVLPFEFSPR